MARRERVVLLGAMSSMPVAGVVWQVVHYLAGLERLGYEAYYVEAHARTPAMLMTTPADDSSELAAAWIHRQLSRFGLGKRWAFHALHADGRYFGMSRSELDVLYREAAAIINLHGATEPREELTRTGRLVYLETDPVQLQVEIAAGEARTLAFLDAHSAFFTFAANYGHPDCLLPVTDRYPFIPTRQPVVLDYWVNEAPAGAHFTTIGNWKQMWRPVEIGGELLTWSKHLEFEKVRLLPRLTGATFELALSTIDLADVEALEAEGWRVRNALDVSTDVDDYRAFISSSTGEFTVAKEQNVRLRTGWFSDRSASYLASGRPVVTQDTGYELTLPAGEGLLPFSGQADAADAIRSVTADWPRHSSAARKIAREHFAHDVVLSPLLDQIGVSGPRRTSRIQTHEDAQPVALPESLDLVPVRKNPTVLAPATIAYLDGRPVHSLPNGRAVSDPEAALVLVTRNNLPFLRLALESVLTARTATTFEIAVVDNASTDGTWEYLGRMSQANPAVTALRSATNLGFAGGVNWGVGHTRGKIVVLLNDDVIVGDDWLDLLVCPLAEPAVGMVGPAGEAIPLGSSEAGRSGEGSPEIEPGTPASLGSFRAWATRCAGHSGGTDTDFLAMYCAALRRETIEVVGPLDQSYGLGLFEDDDYCRRLRLAGYRLWRQEALFVHHFGETSIGKLRATGAYTELFAANRGYFEKKWGTTWSPHPRPTRSGYDVYRSRIRAALSEALPAASIALIVSRGDDALLDVPGVVTRHFPLGADGGWSGYSPPDGTQAVADLRRARSDGADYLVLPSHSFWWLSFYPELREYLAGAAQALMEEAELVSVFALEKEKT